MPPVLESSVSEPLPLAKPSIPSQPPAARNLAMDAYRGFVMFLMMAEVLRLSRVAQAFPGNWFWSILAYNQTHVQWAGCSLHDLIQPSFSFLVGVALPFSLARRQGTGQGLARALRRLGGWHCCTNGC